MPQDELDIEYYIYHAVNDLEHAVSLSDYETVRKLLFQHFPKTYYGLLQPATNPSKTVCALLK